MTWYVASCIMAICSDEASVDPVLVFEDFFLIEAADRDVALSKANNIGAQEAAAGAGTMLSGRPVQKLFLGVRKIRSIYGQSHGQDVLPPIDGDELTHSLYEVKNMDVARRLAAGEVVDLIYIDDN